MIHLSNFFHRVFYGHWPHWVELPDHPLAMNQYAQCTFCDKLKIIRDKLKIIRTRNPGPM